MIMVSMSSESLYCILTDISGCKARFVPRQTLTVLLWGTLDVLRGEPPVYPTVRNTGSDGMGVGRSDD